MESVEQFSVKSGAQGLRVSGKRIWIWQATDWTGRLESGSLEALGQPILDLASHSMDWESRACESTVWSFRGSWAADFGPGKPQGGKATHLLLFGVECMPAGSQGVSGSLIFSPPRCRGLVKPISSQNFPPRVWLGGCLVSRVFSFSPLRFRLRPFPVGVAAVIQAGWADY